MSSVELPIYRLPVGAGTRVGSARVVIDRNNERYIDGSRVAEAVPSGIFLLLTLANGTKMTVKQDEYAALKSTRKGKGK